MACSLPLAAWVHVFRREGARRLQGLSRDFLTSRELIWMELPLTRISRFECFEMVLGATKLVGLTRGTMSTQRRGYSGSAWGDPKTKLAWEIQPGRRLCWRRRGGVLVKWFLAKTVVFHPPTSKT